MKNVVICGVLGLSLAVAPACRRAPDVSAETYRQAVVSFYVSLAAMQTSQDLLARKELDRLTQLIPQEPAGWANLGLLLVRQQQLDQASQAFAKASALAPRSAAIERLLALTESRKGNLPESIRHWRRAIEFDPKDLKAPYALAQELERAGGAANEAEAQRLLESLSTRTHNLAAELEYARLAARRRDRAALGRALDALSHRSVSWPVDAQERLSAARAAAQANPASAATPVIFLKNVLIREPAYRAALADVSTPRSEVGEPLVRFVTLENPDPRPAPADEQLTFAADAKPVVALQETRWAGTLWLNGDGRPTVLAVGPRGMQLGTRAAVRFPGRTTTIFDGPSSVAVADLNYDFRNDLAIAGATGLQVFRQTGTGTFAPVTATMKLPADLISAPMHGVWPADIDTDGDLDLVIGLREGAPRVLRNNGDDTFAVQSPFGDVTNLRGFAWADVDGEGVPDAALLDARGVVRVFLNLRGAQFVERRASSGFPRSVAITAMETSGDGIMDVVGVAADGRVASFFRRSDGTAFDTRELGRIDAPAGLAAGNTQLFPADLDNNGAADFVISGPTASRVLLAVADGSFHELRDATLPGALTSAADLDGDGRLELAGSANTGARVVRVKGQKSYHWQAIRPRAVTATGDQRINSFGIGGEVEVRTGLHVQKQAIATPVVHFGLGQATGVEVARINWPNGVLQSEFNVPGDKPVAASQRLKGSCPWLFAWNGTDMGFVTDFIWRSPLGLRINSQATADVQMTGDWVKVRGDQLQPRDGHYDLRITAELWETHFFDLVSLLVVDHPAGTEVFVDERFAVPPPPLSVVATSPVRDVLSARDDRGLNVTALVRTRDDRHLDITRGPYQGVAREHYVELELPPDAPATAQLFLVGQGWVHPTDSSINVAIAQGGHAAPTGLSLSVADAKGRFKTVRTGLGFPSGKDKTVLIDLTGVFRGEGPRRLRLTTNLEIYWDRIGWAVGRPDVKLSPRKLELKQADLQYRGYSVTEQKDPATPERPRYVLDGIAPRWRDLEGFHTRFGDVRELLDRIDDRYLIMNAGDELRLGFPATPPPPPGFVRDFVLAGDGWVKDGDYNTVASRTVLPLPTHRTPGYVPGTGRLEDDPLYVQHRADFERYHTRFVSPDALRDALRIKIGSHDQSLNR